ncbi:hypothetical protein Tco_1513138, partial [Tanacetum coccineum]
EERPATPKPAWIIPSSNVSDVENNRASVLTELTQADFEGQAYEVVKAFYPDVIHLQFQMEECHKMLTAQGSNPALSISKMKAASYPDFGLELLVSEQIHDSLSCRKDVRTHMRILSVVRIKAYSRYGYDYFSKIVLRRADFQEHTITERDVKNLYPSDFEDLNLLLLQGHLDHLPGWDATGYEFKHDYTIIESPRVVVFPVDNNDRKIMRFIEIYKFSDRTLTRILEALDYKVKEFKVKRINPGMNTRFWTEKDVIRSKEFIAAIERQLKMRMIYQNLECFVGGRVHNIDHRLLQRTE